MIRKYYSAAMLIIAIFRGSILRLKRESIFRDKKDEIWENSSK